MTYGCNCEGCTCTTTAPTTTGTVTQTDDGNDITDAVIETQITDAGIEAQITDAPEPESSNAGIIGGVVGGIIVVVIIIIIVLVAVKKNKQRKTDGRYAHGHSVTQIINNEFNDDVGSYQGVTL
jgi:hypothetical protein